ncbi:hypothetical protein C8R43DRAFT_1063909 [Mycena crocata]|nr:hypothetical protein C8R43DRAFT_1063909 [Mycena crocata]
MSNKKRNPRPHRGARSSAGSASRKEKYMQPNGVHALGQKKIQSITKVIRPATFPLEFVSCLKNAKKVRKVISKLDIGDIRNLPKITEDDNDIVLIPSPELTPEQAACFAPAGMPKYTLKKMHPEMKTSLELFGPPPYLGIRFSQVISPSAQNKLWAAYKLLVSLGVQFPPAELARSSSPALHFGVWELYKLMPIITGDSRQEGLPEPQRSQVIAAIDALLQLFKDLVLPKAKRLLAQHVPDQLRLLKPVHDRVKAKLRKEFAQRPALDFDGVFFCMAAKEGSSEEIHLDFNDNLAFVTFIVACAEDGQEWTGGEFCAPQIGVRIPFRPGQVLAVRTRLLAHCGATVTGGRRLVFTCFSDSVLLEHSLFGTGKNKGRAVVVL